MKPKIVKNNKKLPVGLHLVEITHFDMIKTETGQIAMKGGFPKGLQVKFKEVNGDQVGTKNFSVKKTTMWLLENFSTAIGVDLTGTERPHAKEIIGRKLWIMVIVIRMCRNGVPIEEVGSFGRPSYKQYAEIGSRFFKYDGVAAPSPLGNPDISNPTGWYIQHRDEMP